MIIFHIFTYFRSLIYAIIYNYKIFLTDIFLIAVSFLTIFSKKSPSSISGR